MPSGGKLRAHMLKNAGGVKLRNYADGLYIDFPMNWSEQLKQYVWRSLVAEADRLGVTLGQYREDT